MAFYNNQIPSVDQAQAPLMNQAQSPLMAEQLGYRNHIPLNSNSPSNWVTHRGSQISPLTAALLSGNTQFTSFWEGYDGMANGRSGRAPRELNAEDSNVEDSTPRPQ